MEKEKIVYYQDELNDDFAGNDISTKKVSNNFKYIHHSWLFKVNAFLLKYLFAAPLLWLANKIVFHVKIENKRVLKSFKKKGYYLYANHVLPYDPIILPVNTHYGKTTIITAGPDLFSISGFVTWLVKHFGAIPIPNMDKEMTDNFVECLSYMPASRRLNIRYIYNKSVNVIHAHSLNRGSGKPLHQEQTITSTPICTTRTI